MGEEGEEMIVAMGEQDIGGLDFEGATKSNCS